MLPALSLDGRYVAFKSNASNLVSDDHNETVDVFVRDRQWATTLRVSVSFLNKDSNDGSYPPSIDDSGRFVAFSSAANNIVRDDYNQVPSVFVRDMANAVNLLVDLNGRGEQANQGTIDIAPSISGDGKALGFVSRASNLVPEPVYEQGPNVFLNVKLLLLPGRRVSRRFRMRRQRHLRAQERNPHAVADPDARPTRMPVCVRRADLPGAGRRAVPG